MNKIDIEWCYDSTDCDQAGCSGGFAEGAIVKINGIEIGDFTPIAHCYEPGFSYSREDVYHRA